MSLKNTIVLLLLLPLVLVQAQTLNYLDYIEWFAQFPIPGDISYTLKSYDFIIVGTGASGSIVANRLSANSGVSVLILEAGGPGQRDTGGVEFAVPKYQQNADGSYSQDIPYTRWDVPFLWQTAWGQSGLSPAANSEWNVQGNNAAAIGKVAGGCHSHNSLNWVRAQPEDVDGWNVTGWSYDDLLQYWVKAENFSSARVHGQKPYHGYSGPIQITDPAIVENEGLTICNASLNAGYGYTDDHDAPTNNTGCSQVHLNMRNGVRDSSAVAYLFKVKSRRNLTIRLQAQVTRVLFNGTKAIGVEVHDIVTNRTFHIRANKEVIVSGGSLNTPKILIFSGIGPAAELAHAGVTPLVVNENVGRNIKNNMKYGSTYAYANEVHPNLYDYYVQQVKYSQTGTGYLASMLQDTNIYLRPNNTYIGELLVSIIMPNPSNVYLNQINVNMLVSRPDLIDGYITVNSTNPLDDNLFYYQNLSALLQSDIDKIIDGIQAIRVIMNTPPAQGKFVETAPGTQYQTHDELNTVVRAALTYVQHYIGSCKMGNPGDPLAVVDPHFRVNGVSNLRIVDASVIPGHWRGLPQATVVAVAEKGAATIMADNNIH